MSTDQSPIIVNWDGGDVDDDDDGIVGAFDDGGGGGGGRGLSRVLPVIREILFTHFTIHCI
jgi:hypothetical protein